jgi:hypothetical protein
MRTITGVAALLGAALLLGNPVARCYVFERTESIQETSDNVRSDAGRSLILSALEFTRRILMKRIEYLFNPATARTFAAGVLVATISLVSGSVAAAEATAASRVEVRIHDMHARLAITAEQEDQWKQVAQVMRDNELALEPLIQDRKTNAGTMTAIDDLKSYAAITDAHFEGIKKFTTAFGTLYDSMSEAQRKNADALFRKSSQKVPKVK